MSGPSIPVERLLAPAEVASRLGIAVRTLWRGISLGTIPAPSVRLSRKIVRWREDDINNFIRKKATRSISEQHTEAVSAWSRHQQVDVAVAIEEACHHRLRGIRHKEIGGR